MPPTITSPLHILHLSQPDTPQIALFKGSLFIPYLPICSHLIGWSPAKKKTKADSRSLAQTTALIPDIETHEISTAYYTASIPIWRDHLPSTPATIAAWKEEWSAPEASEVVQAVGAWVVSFRKARTANEVRVLRDVLSCISAVIERHTAAPTNDDGGGMRYVIDEEKPLMLAVGMQHSGVIGPSLDKGVEEWEDLCRECGGWEWIDGTEVDDEEEKVDGGLKDGGSKMKSVQAAEGWDDLNEYREKVGMARLKEALEAHEWEGRGGDDFEDLDDLGFGGDDDDASLGFGEEAMEAQMEIWGMQSDVRKEEGQRVEDEENDTEPGSSQVGDQDVQELETMMLKMQAVRDMGGDMAEGERKKFAAKAVREVLKKM